MSAESEPLPATTPTAQQRIEEVLAEHRYSEDRDTWLGYCECGEKFPQCGYEEWSAHVAAAVVASLELREEEQWVPVEEGGNRWEPRGKELAHSALALYSAGGPCDFEDTVPLSHVVHESRVVGPWRTTPTEGAEK